MRRGGAAGGGGGEGGGGCSGDETEFVAKVRLKKKISTAALFYSQHNLKMRKRVRRTGGGRGMRCSRPRYEMLFN